jgi:hypothetical protein
VPHSLHMLMSFHNSFSNYLAMLLQGFRNADDSDVANYIIRFVDSYDFFFG